MWYAARARRKAARDASLVGAGPGPVDVGAWLVYIAKGVIPEAGLT